VDELHTLAKRLRFEEIKRLQVPDKLGVRLGEGAVVERPVLRRCVGEADLLGKNGLAATRGAGEDDEGTRLEPAPENQIEVGKPRFQPPCASF